MYLEDIYESVEELEDHGSVDILSCGSYEVHVGGPVSRERKKGIY
jgi:hypothetical protein